MYACHAVLPSPFSLLYFSSFSFLLWLLLLWPEGLLRERKAAVMRQHDWMQEIKALLQHIYEGISVFTWGMIQMAVFLTRYMGLVRDFMQPAIDHRPILGAGPSAVDQLDKMEHYAMHLLRGRQKKIILFVFFGLLLRKLMWHPSFMLITLFCTQTNQTKLDRFGSVFFILSFFLPSSFFSYQEMKKSRTNLKNWLEMIQTIFFLKTI